MFETWAAADGTVITIRDAEFAIVLSDDWQGR